jgi:hypothetical protein
MKTRACTFEPKRLRSMAGWAPYAFFFEVLAALRSMRKPIRTCT